MPWNDNANPGPWGSPPPPERGKPSGPAEEPKRPQRPQGGGPRRPPPEGVDLNELLERWATRLRGVLQGGGGGGGGDGPSPEESLKRYGPIIAGGLVVVYLLAGVIVVGAREKAVVTTFGAWTRSYGPGIGYHLPLMERSFKVDITSINETIVGGVKADTLPQESLMLTGDENIVDLTFAVNWRVSDPGKYLFNVSDPRGTVKAVAESAMREVVGRSKLDPIISTGRGQLQAQAADLMQRILDGYDSGVIIDSIQIRDAQPPKPVVAAFQDVATAGQNFQAKVNAAGGEASRVKQAALGYKAQVVNEAVGEAQRFNQIYEQYRLAPGVTRERLYIETMERVLSRSNKVIIDGKGVTAPIVLSPDTFRSRNPAPTATAAPAASPSQGAAQ
ncbi:MAG: FtsH protease activity modulator HflK [Caulobacter sp.]|nr:FtsH protease activity modulator HflK [Caulobacter sp.]